MKTFSVALLTLLLVSGCTNSEDHLRREADKIHNNYLTVDTHCDTPMNLVESDYDLGVRHDKGCVDFPRMKEGGLDAEFLAVFTSQGPRNDSTYRKVFDEALKIIDSIHKNVEKNSTLAELAYSPDDAYRIKKDEDSWIHGD